jgi:capsular polysaccharide transport system ATP-binding protein
MCTTGLVLEDGRVFYYPRIERAIEHHEYLMRGSIPPWLR